MAQGINDLIDILHESRCKLAFMGDVLSQETMSVFHFSSDGESGLFFIMREIDVMIEHVSNELSEYNKEVK